MGKDGDVFLDGCSACASCTRAMTAAHEGDVKHTVVCMSAQHRRGAGARLAFFMSAAVACPYPCTLTRTWASRALHSDKAAQQRACAWAPHLQLDGEELHVAVLAQEAPHARQVLVRAAHHDQQRQQLRQAHGKAPALRATSHAVVHLDLPNTGATCQGWEFGVVGEWGIWAPLMDRLPVSSGEWSKRANVSRLDLIGTSLGHPAASCQRARALLRLRSGLAVLRPTAILTALAVLHMESKQAQWEP